MFPIRYGLENAALGDVEFITAPPAELNARLLAGEIDASAMSSVAFLEAREQLVLLPSSITAVRRLGSVTLFARVPLQRVRSVAATPRSGTSVILLTLLAGPKVAIRSLREPPGRALRAVDAVLLIGDEALTAPAGLAPHRIDLAAEWLRRTGLPMVFAVWAARRGFVRSEPASIARLRAALLGAQADHRADPSAAVGAAVDRYPFGREFVASYLARLRFSLGPDECAALELLGRRPALWQSPGMSAGGAAVPSEPASRQLQDAVDAPR